MTVTSVDDFLRAEEQAHRLVDQLDQLAQQMAHYKAAHDALDGAGKSLQELSTRLAVLAGDMSAVIETLRAIGTPEILRAQQETAETVLQEIRSMEEARQEDADWIGDVLVMIRGAAVGGAALSLVAVGLLAWLVLGLGGG
jgi:uncharacterized protein (DUF3084 family)